MRRPLVAANWKMNHLAEDALRFVHHLPDIRERHAGVDLAVFPPATLVMLLARALSGTRVDVGGQTCHFDASGAFTGEISAPMLRDAGCTRVIVGHGERRRLFHETDEDVRLRVGAALSAGLLPLACVGETLDEREAGRTQEVLARQADAALRDLDADEASRVTLAYEPLWAIGTGRAATPEAAQEAHGFLRERLRRRFGRGVADGARILYGGSVSPENARPLLAGADVDGALVGTASLSPDSFAAIVAAAAR